MKGGEVVFPAGSWVPVLFRLSGISADRLGGTSAPWQRPLAGQGGGALWTIETSSWNNFCFAGGFGV